MLMSVVGLYPRIIVSNSHGNTSKYVDTVTIFQKKKLNQKVNDPKMTFDPTSVEVTCHMCDSTQGSVTLFFQKTKQNKTKKP